MWLMVVFHLVNSHWGKAQVFVQGLDLCQRKDYPGAGINEVSIFITEEVTMQVGRGVQASCSTSSNVVGIPRRIIHIDSNTFIAETLQVGSGSVWYVLDHGGKVGRSPHIMDKRFPGRGRTQVARQISYGRT